MTSQVHPFSASVVWIAEFGDRPSVVLAKALLDEGMTLTTQPSGADWLRQYAESPRQAEAGVATGAATHPADLILLSVTHWSAAVEQFCQRLQQCCPEHPPVIVITLPQAEPSFDAAFALGIYDYLIRPMAWPLITQRLRHGIEHHRCNRQLQQLKGHEANLTYQLTQAKQRLERSQRRDDLTQLLNRSAFEDALDLFWRLHVRGQQTLSLILLELGYQTLSWDEVATTLSSFYLRHLGQSILDHLKRPGDLACRYQEKQLMILLPHTDQKGAQQWLQILKTSWQLDRDNQPQLQLQPSPLWFAGVSSHRPVPGESIEMLTEQVKQALLASKETATAA